ncbi:MAG: polysaccharide deacetylase family protein [Bacilli bacterium]
MLRFYYIIYQRLLVLINRKKNASSCILMFHKISESNDAYSINVARFNTLIKWLTEKSTIRAIDDSHLQNNKNYILTFDDVDISVYDEAYPILAKLNVPYYIFVTIELINKEGYLSEDNIKEMLSNSQCIIGSHAMNHILMRKLSMDECEYQMIKSKEYIEKKFSVNCDSFAFPFGSIYACSNKNYQVAKKHYKYIFNTLDIPFDGDFTHIPRININNNCKFVRRILK